MFLLLALVLSGCSLDDFTSRFVQDIDGKNNDDFLLEYGVRTRNVSMCNDIVFSLKREECFIGVAKLERNPVICQFIENYDLRENCMKWVE